MIKLSKQDIFVTYYTIGTSYTRSIKYKSVTTFNTKTNNFTSH